MTANDRAQFLEIVVGFAELKGRVLSAPALELYWRALSAWPLEDFKRAAEHLLSKCVFMPTPKDFEDLRRAGRPTAGEAFARAVDHAASGAWRAGPMGEPLIDAAVAALGGYAAIARCFEENLHYLERRFTEHHEAMQDAADVREALPQIAGEHFAAAGQLARTLQQELAAPRSARKQPTWGAAHHRAPLLGRPGEPDSRTETADGPQT